MGAAGCQCLGSLPSEIAVVDCTYDWAVDGKCLEKDNLPGNYGEQCGVHAEPGDADCYTQWQGDLPTPRPDPEFWCGQKWCYVDPCNCDMSDATLSTYFGVDGLAYSYSTCGGSNGYTDRKFPDQNMVGNANLQRYEGDCSEGPAPAPTPDPTEPLTTDPRPETPAPAPRSPTYKVEYDVQFTADIDKTEEELMADSSFLAGLMMPLSKAGWLLAPLSHLPAS
jgi:hypothetical protein